MGCPSPGSVDQATSREASGLHVLRHIQADDLVDLLLPK
jgi:hypothetical protein